MSNKLYRPRRKRKKEKLSLIDKIEIGGITIAAVVLIGWSSWSIVDSFTPDPVIPSREVYTDGISSYIAGLTSDSDSTDAESTSATDTDSSDTDIKDADSDKKEEKDDETAAKKKRRRQKQQPLQICRRQQMKQRRTRQRLQPHQARQQRLLTQPRQRQQKLLQHQLPTLPKRL